MPVISTLASLSKKGYFSPGNLVAGIGDFYSATDYNTSTGNVTVQSTVLSDNSYYQILQNTVSSGTTTGCVIKYNDSGATTELNYGPVNDVKGVVKDTLGNIYFLVDRGSSTPFTYFLYQYNSSGTFTNGISVQYNNSGSGNPTNTVLGMTIDSSNNILVFLYGSNSGNIYFITNQLSASSLSLTRAYGYKINTVQDYTFGSLKLISSYNNYNMIGFNTPTYTFVVPFSNLGQTTASYRMTPSGSGQTFAGTMIGANFYYIINNILVKTPYNDFVPSYAYTVATPPGAGTYWNAMSGNSDNNLVLSSSSSSGITTALINPSNPISLISNPVQFSITNINPLTNSIVTNSTNLFLGFEMRSNVGPIYNTTATMKLDKNASSLSGSNLLNYTLNTHTYSTTISSTTLSSLSITSNSLPTTTITPSTALFALVTNSIGSVSNSATIYNYKQNLI